MTIKNPYGNRIQRFLYWVTYSEKCEWCDKTYRPFKFWHNIEDCHYSIEDYDNRKESH